MKYASPIETYNVMRTQYATREIYTIGKINKESKIMEPVVLFDANERKILGLNPKYKEVAQNIYRNIGEGNMYAVLMSSVREAMISKCGDPRKIKLVVIDKYGNTVDVEDI